MREKLNSLTTTTPLFSGVYALFSIGNSISRQGRGVVSRYSDLVSKSPTTQHRGAVCQDKLGVQDG